MKMRILSAALLLTFGNAAQAATTADISVTGTLKPATCTLTLGGATEATVDYGTIAPYTLSLTEVTPLAVRSVPLKIVCDAPITVAVNAVDNKIGTNPITGSISPQDGDSPISAAYLYGLGANGSGKIGGYSLTVSSRGKVDGAEATMVYSSNKGQSWGIVSGGGSAGNILGSGGSGHTDTWHKWGSLAGSTFEADLMVRAFIDKRVNLNLSGDIALNGSATIEILYL